ncbi:MFS transporter [Jiangella ureilytica]|uniref:MFS transporter n=1 Tax=Jiangella ureilytica TaxID=2530374 RepID=A0A4R4RS02_9ACTN|nr:MFS transporter [Jiangella ureilytica]TDC52778.1 MFS transporter [Jiangella ureilytica]
MNPGLRVVVVICVLALVEGVAVSLLRPFIAPYAVSLGAGATVVGIAVALSQVSGLLIAVPFGAAADSIGSRRLVTSGAITLSAGAALLAFTGTIGGLLVSQFIIGLGTLAVGLAIQALATRPFGSEDHDPRRVTGFATFTLVGNLIGPALGGILIDLDGYATAFSAVVVMGLLSVLISLLLPSSRLLAETTQSIVAKVRVSGLTGLLLSPYRGAGDLFREPVVRIVVLASGLAVGLTHLRNSFLPLYFENLGWSSSLIGVLLSATAAAGIVSRVLHPVLDRRLPMWIYLGGSLVLGAVAIVATVLTSSLAVVVVTMVVSGFMLGAGNPITLTLVARRVATDRRGLAVGLRLTVNRLTTAVGPVLFGALATVGGVRMTMGAISAAGAVAGAAATRRFRAVSDD